MWWSSSANMCYGWAGGRASVPPGMDSCVVSIRRRCWLVGACRVVQLSCYELHEGKHHGCSRSTAWRRHLQLAEQLECCCGCAWRRAARGVPPTTVEAAQRRSSVGLGLGRARSIDLPGLRARPVNAAHCERPSTSSDMWSCEQCRQSADSLLTGADRC